MMYTSLYGCCCPDMLLPLAGQMGRVFRTLSANLGDAYADAIINMGDIGAGRGFADGRQLDIGHLRTYPQGAAHPHGQGGGTTMKIHLILLIAAMPWAFADDKADCAAGQGTYLTGSVTKAPWFKHGYYRKGVELSHTHLLMQADQDGKVYDVAIDNVFAEDYAPAPVVPASLRGIAVHDRLAVCGQTYPGGIHWVHTDCGATPTPHSPNGFLKRIGEGGMAGDNLEGAQARCKIF